MKYSAFLPGRVVHGSFCAIIFLFSVLSCQTEESKPQKIENSAAPRIISLSGCLTETLFDLGYGSMIVGRDVTSTYPQEAKAIADLGHITQLNTEAILQLNPTIIFLEEEQRTQTQALQSLEQAGITIVAIPTATSLNNALRIAQKMKTHLPIEEQTLKNLKQQITEDSLALGETLNPFTDHPKVLFIYARGAGRLMAGGKNTPAAVIIEKAGGINAIQSFDNYQALTPEALVEAQPSVILMFDTGLKSLNGKTGLEQIPGISQTPAFQQNRIVAMDGHYLTSFSSRAGKAARELATLIHAE